MDRDYVLKDGDKIVHETVREETPVIETLPSVIRETPSYLVVDKPSSMPVHSCGNFRHNTLQEILKNELNYTKPPEGAGEEEASKFRG